MFVLRVKGLARLCRCAGSLDPSLVAYVKHAPFTSVGTNTAVQLRIRTVTGDTSK